MLEIIALSFIIGYWLLVTCNFTWPDNGPCGVGNVCWEWRKPPEPVDRFKDAPFFVWEWDYELTAWILQHIPEGCAIYDGCEPRHVGLPGELHFSDPEPVMPRLFLSYQD